MKQRSPLAPSLDGTTVSSAFVTGMLAGCAVRGMALEKLLDHVEIASDVLSDPGARVPLPRYAALYNHLTATLDDEGFALFAQPLRIGCFEFLCRSVITAPTLGEALQRAARFLRIVLPELEVSIARQGPQALLCIDETRPLHTGRVFAFEWLLRLLHGLACWLADRSLVLDRVDFPYPRPPHASDYALIYTADSRFNSLRLQAWFAAPLLELPIRRDEAALALFLAGAPGRISTLYRRDREIATRVRDTLHASLPDWPDLRAVAARLHLSPRTLHRRLHEEGTHFQAIKDSLRRDLAKDSLSKTRRPLARIASDLGFADATAFYRAFVTWTGMAPKAYRKSLEKASEPLARTTKSTAMPAAID